MGRSNDLPPERAALLHDDRARDVSEYRRRGLTEDELIRAYGSRACACESPMPGGELVGVHICGHCLLPIR